MTPDTYVPTCTFVTGLTVPLPVTVLATVPREIGAVVYRTPGAAPTWRHASAAPVETRTMTTAIVKRRVAAPGVVEPFARNLMLMSLSGRRRPNPLPAFDASGLSGT